ncbi:hypothetical protein LCGC14_2056880 [marine sediment metagenome]|uniref:Uncharacterized protein n=1 Tax=marine sediment metagenome TaxID=412755 RepID=A0A0F9H0U0_9ZZZZ
MPDKKIIHLITQDNQPYMSVRKCCQRCGTAVWNLDAYVKHEEDLDRACKEEGYKLCTD